ncbi:putative pyridoxal 5 -phosphate synthase subunit PDX2 [Chlorella sorokiniana]|uniref:glutaminase n=1 Tax=Chlorella sorokiniana TaxID=3076 RepID=A0A2P6THR4_CHLSO|nr:putative pyridoxal 5 -phosphate synthase subunit PDX2 [Chlorella sorokiniana]|eukprot:PRW33817.1 putative pyridoxal 5 -phosphate synthase subunit PDX2 [Chlorella sorokiniana]
MACPIRIGVLALQGSFREHMTLLNRIPGVEAVEVRTKEELQSVAGLIIPGGESTTMALVAERWGLIPELRQFAAEQRPIWGTCAGLIFLANRASGMKEGGQALLGGLDCMVQRNFFGAQINSFETQLPAPACLPRETDASNTFRAVFIRAPAIVETGPGVEVLAEYTLTPEEAAAQQHKSVIVAVRDSHLMATAFHPELTQDTRWHELFVEMVQQHAAEVAAAAAGAPAPDPWAKLGRPPNRPADLPVY